MIVIVQLPLDSLPPFIGNKNLFTILKHFERQLLFSYNYSTVGEACNIEHCYILRDQPQPQLDRKSKFSDMLHKNMIRSRALLYAFMQILTRSIRNSFDNKSNMNSL